MQSGIVFDQVVGAVLVHYRKRAGLNQHEAVKGTEIGVSSLSRLEKGDYSLGMEQLFVLSHRYNVSMQEITTSIEKTYTNAVNKGVSVENEKKSNTGLLLLGAAAIAALVIASN
ncbi:helix-turn-helix domain-containing protein [Teredinibacter haidensis]|uniref:helix-turn-helix domain-containing protein n=1 Tax=Teredinibacter haidensis TaxID=2731755 RepID=UPI000948D7C8|nr:helix-turn-helix transcriptional regulator [Teredinibacter haidensis]